MFSIEASILINSQPEKVWDTLLDFNSYHQWNKLLDYLEGEPKVGEKIKLRLTLADGPNYVFEPSVTNCKENELFSWKGTTFVSGIFDGEHFFEIKPVNNQQTKLINREVFSGILSPLVRRSGMLKSAQPGFEMMNIALKNHIEGT